MLSIPLPKGRTIPVLVARALVLGKHQAEFHLGNLGKSPALRLPFCIKAGRSLNISRVPPSLGNQPFSGLEPGAYRFHCLGE